MPDSRPHPRLALAPLFIGVTVVAACAARGGITDQNTPAGRVITAADIQKTGASTAWEALKFTVRSHYFHEYKGQPVRIMSNRGQGSLLLIEEPQVFLDGARLTEITVLRYMPAHTIDNIRILSGADGTTYFGTNAAAGVILIETGMGLDPFFDVDTVPKDTSATRLRHSVPVR